MADAYYSDEHATFGDRVAAAREAAGLSQAQLARRLGVKLQTVASWEADRSEPRANRLQMLAGMLNVSMVWLMTGAGEGVSPPAETAAHSLESLLTELRETRMAQVRLAERLGRLEKRLRAAVDAERELATPE
jgi:transcriptional regulator with XRE-family HTH domain